MMEKKILLVDDNVTLAECMHDILEIKGYKAKAVNSGKDALSEIAKKPYDVVIMDIKMPELDGVCTLIELKKIKPDMRVIMMTGFASGDRSSEALKAGALEVILKPIDFEKLFTSLNKLMKNNE
ncbi:MAG TPA: two-component system response regulator [Lentisphaeria bacterium]|nr:MAG: hypothetical protein A2X47_01660 [Lentisphaerae bacterium GWF2_38_69]HBM15640.1 two-component system response regulator [Lentisphaeria bacterium]